MTDKEKMLGLALQRLYYRGVSWSNQHQCSDPTCPSRDMVANLVGLAESALKESGLEGQLLGRVGVPPLRPASANQT